MESILLEAKQSFFQLSKLDEETKNKALLRFSELIAANSTALLEANQLDLLENKEKISQVLFQRLKLDSQKLVDLSEGILKLSEEPVCVDKLVWKRQMKKSCPLVAHKDSTVFLFFINCRHAKPGRIEFPY